MKLLTVYFDAFRSLLGKKIELKDNCIGLVGINESGKSNVLYAINALRDGYPLSIKDIPKMNGGKIDPTIRYEFKLTEDEREKILEKVRDWTEGNTLIGRDLNCTDFNLMYTISYSIKENKIKKSAELINFSLNKGYLLLKKENLNDSYKIKIGNQFVNLSNALIVNEKIVAENKKYIELFNDITKIEKDIQALALNIDDYSNHEKNANKDTQEKFNQDTLKKKTEFEKLTKKKNELEDKVKEFNILDIEKANLAKLKDFDDQLRSLKVSESDLKNKIIQYENIPNPTPANKSQITQLNNKRAQVESSITKLQKEKNSLQELHDNFMRSIEEKYTADPTEIFSYIGNSILLKIEEILPKVVFWEHKDDYILHSETLFKDINSKSSLEDISRPLVNILRIGMGIKSISELKLIIKEISLDPNTRSQLTKTMDKNINKYIKDVWPEYDQSLNISIENDRIRVEIYDGKCNNASFYNMEDRSQGAKTFLSFLFTIGAEAKHGILKNSILLLDEPESHLHPSGVRYLLSELKKIADKGNQVIYATHSPYMIDREHYERHFITSKAKEKTNIEPSCIDRVGIFTQEEVLYSTLDKELLDGHRSLNDINFVFEGMGDVLLFEHFYCMILDKKPFKLENVSFYHGGGCTRILEFLKNKPIQLGTKWIFILDKDKDGDRPKDFIENQYKDYIQKDIFIFQYDLESKESEIVLEDLINDMIISNCYKNVHEKYGIKYNPKITEAKIKRDSFNDYHEEIISNVLFQDDYVSAKGDFKVILNFSIKEKLEKISNEEEFKKEFPNYYEWVKLVIGSFEKKKTEEKK